jgi:hypothetical protein
MIPDWTCVMSRRLATMLMRSAFVMAFRVDVAFRIDESLMAASPAPPPGRGASGLKG